MRTFLHLAELMPFIWLILLGKITVEGYLGSLERYRRSRIRIGAYVDSSRTQ